VNVTVLATCITCDGAKALKAAAIDEGYTVIMETVKRSDDRTRRSGEAGIGLPVLVRDDGALSDDGKNWVGGEPKQRIHVTHPVSEVVDYADDDNS